MTEWLSSLTFISITWRHWRQVYSVSRWHKPDREHWWGNWYLPCSKGFWQATRTVESAKWDLTTAFQNSTVFICYRASFHGISHGVLVDRKVNRHQKGYKLHCWNWIAGTRAITGTRTVSPWLCPLQTPTRSPHSTSVWACPTSHSECGLPNCSIEPKYRFPCMTLALALVPLSGTQRIQ